MPPDLEPGGERCAPGCIDARIEEQREQERQERDSEECDDDA